jgi:hypothetical protein
MKEMLGSVVIFVVKGNVPCSVVSPTMEATLIIPDNWRVICVDVET